MPGGTSLRWYRVGMDDTAADMTATSADPHAGHTMTSPAGAPAASLSGEMPMCAEMPSMANCSSYRYPDARSEMDIEANCEAMPFMVACSVWTACKSGDMSGDLCEPFNVLASACQDQGMMNMPGCAVYTPMCLNADDSVVNQCTGAGISRLVSTMPTQVCALCTPGLVHKLFKGLRVISFPASILSYQPGSLRCLATVLLVLVLTSGIHAASNSGELHDTRDAWLRRLHRRRASMCRHADHSAVCVPSPLHGYVLWLQQHVCGEWRCHGILLQQPWWHLRPTHAHVLPQRCAPATLPRIAPVLFLDQEFGSLTY